MADSKRKPAVVIGAGPAGIAAALAASRTHHTILLDEEPAPGGHPRWWPDHEPDVSSDMETTLREAGVDHRPGTSVWALFGGPIVAAYDDTRAFSIDAASVVIATGGIDRAWPLPGWELHGVSTVEPILRAIATGELSPGTRVGIVGDDPVVPRLIHAIEQAGGSVVLHAPDITSARIDGITSVDSLGNGSRSVAVDRVALALGRRPDPTLGLMARMASAFDRSALIEMPLLDEIGATSIPGVYLTGEAAGISGDDVIRDHGHRAGEAAASDARAGRLAPPAVTWSPAPPLPADGDTIVCRQQMVDLRTVQTAIRRGAYDVNDLRRQTRAGMGLAITNDTLSVLAALLLRRDPAIDDARLVARVRPPARPLPFHGVTRGVRNGMSAGMAHAAEEPA